MSSIFDLVGTPTQNDIVRSALSRCTFPFERLLPGLREQTGRSTLPVNWQDLSRYAAQLAVGKASGGHGLIREGGDTGKPVERRERVLGLAWYSGRVTLDNSLEADPELAAEVLISEVAHMADFFVMTDEQRRLIFNAFHGSAQDPAEHGHAWFDEGTYESWLGEAFMGAFTLAYSDVPVTIAFEHAVTPYVVRRVREVLTPPPQPPMPELPTLAPSGEVFGVSRGRVYHDLHSGVRREQVWPDARAAEADGRRACKVCRPD